MRKDTVEFKRKVTPIGGSFGITIPKELFDFLGANNTSQVAMSGFSGKHGKYVAFWVDQHDAKEFMTPEDIKEVIEKRVDQD